MDVGCWDDLPSSLRLEDFIVPKRTGRRSQHMKQVSGSMQNIKKNNEYPMNDEVEPVAAQWMRSGASEDEKQACMVDSSLEPASLFSQPSHPLQDGGEIRSATHSDGAVTFIRWNPLAERWIHIGYVKPDQTGLISQTMARASKDTRFHDENGNHDVKAFNNHFEQSISRLCPSEAQADGTARHSTATPLSSQISRYFNTVAQIAPSWRSDVTNLSSCPKMITEPVSSKTHDDALNARNHLRFLANGFSHQHISKAFTGKAYYSSPRELSQYEFEPLRRQSENSSFPPAEAWPGFYNIPTAAQAEQIQKLVRDHDRSRRAEAMQQAMGKDSNVEIRDESKPAFKTPTSALGPITGLVGMEATFEKSHLAKEQAVRRTVAHDPLRGGQTPLLPAFVEKFPSISSFKPRAVNTPLPTPLVGSATMHFQTQDTFESSSSAPPLATGPCFTKDAYAGYERGTYQALQALATRDQSYEDQLDIWWNSGRKRALQARLHDAALGRNPAIHDHGSDAEILFDCFNHMYLHLLEYEVMRSGRIVRES